MVCEVALSLPASEQDQHSQRRKTDQQIQQVGLNPPVLEASRRR
jgi:hypothetical protein